MEARVMALEAAIQAMKERNEVLEADRRLLGARVAELEERLLRAQRAPDAGAPAPKQAGGAATRKGRFRAVLRRARAAGRRRRRTAGADRKDGKPKKAPPGSAPVLEVRDRLHRQDQPRRLRVLGVLDTMSAACFAEVVDLVLPDTANAAEMVRTAGVDLVLIESAWQGNGGAWQYQVGSYATPAHRGLPALRKLVDAAERQGVPTAFWNKEDPVHFTKFAEAARTTDYVFTTDAHRISTYQALKGRAQRVEALEFAAQPSLHNPLSGEARSPSPVFAGTFYQQRHADRQDALRMLLEAAAPYGLVIYDRMHGSGQAGFDFPESVADRVVGSLPYSELVHEYKKHRVFLNANSVTESPTMFARRVFELLACGTPVVSTPSRGMVETFGELVDAVDSGADAKAALDRLLLDDAYWRARSREGIRTVMLKHTYAHRLAQIARTIGLAEPLAGPSVALVCATPAEVASTLRVLENLRGVDEIAVPADTPGEQIRPFYARESPVRRVVRVDARTTDQPRTMIAAANTVHSDWLVPAADVLEHDPILVTDLAVATVFTPAPLVIARPHAGPDQLYTVSAPGAGDILARRSSDVARGVDETQGVIAWVRG